MSEVLKDFILVQTIVCPFCRHKQTGIVRIFDLVSGLSICQDPGLTKRIKNIPRGVIPDIVPAIRCAVWTCRELITGEALETTLQKIVQFPSEIYSK